MEQSRQDLRLGHVQSLGEQQCKGAKSFAGGQHSLDKSFKVEREARVSAALSSAEETAELQPLMLQLLLAGVQKVEVLCGEGGSMHCAGHPIWMKRQ